MQGENLLLKTAGEVAEFAAWCAQAGTFALDLETRSLDNRVYVHTVDGVAVKRINNRLVGIGLGRKDRSGYIPIDHPDVKVELDEVRPILTKLLTLSVATIFNAKFDLEVLQWNGFGDFEDVSRWEDVMVMARLDNSARRRLALSILTKEVLGVELDNFHDLCKREQKRIWEMPAEVTSQYCGAQIRATHALFETLLASEFVRVQDKVYKLEKRVVNAVRASIERNRLRIDVEYARSLLVKFTEKLELLTKEICELAGEVVDPGSSKQLIKLLYGKLGFKPPKETAKGNPSVDEEALTKLAQRSKNPLLHKIVEWRSTQKTIGTYLTQAISNVDASNDAKIEFRSVGAETGRITSGAGEGYEVDGCLGIAIQTLTKARKPEDTDLRRMVIARPGHKLIAVDYASEEVRLITNICREPGWIKAFQEGKDPHMETAKVAYGVQNPTDAQRDTAKTGTFTSLYGGGAPAVAAKIGCSLTEAKEVIRKIFDSKPKLKDWVENQHRTVLRDRVVKTIFGRVMRPQFDPANQKQMAGAKRFSVNAPIQGTGADIMKAALVRLHNHLRANPLEDLRVLITNHDEIVAEAPDAKAIEYAAIICEIMASMSRPTWPVPLEVEVKIGPSWSGHVPGTKKYAYVAGKLVVKVDKAKADLAPKPEVAAPTPQAAQPAASKVVAVEAPEPPPPPPTRNLLIHMDTEMEDHLRLTLGKELKVEAQPRFFDRCWNDIVQILNSNKKSGGGKVTLFRGERQLLDGQPDYRYDLPKVWIALRDLERRET